MGKPKSSGWGRERPWKRREWTPAQRRYIHARDAGTCHMCGRQGATIADHVIPLAEGGSSDPDTNGRSICSECHEPKSREEARRGYERHRAQLRLPPEPHPFHMMENPDGLPDEA